jgi:glutamate synthase domain-containing protein 2/glutamate synthase domain-containing protein 1/glutamate synthase domain-containing protein 3
MAFTSSTGHPDHDACGTGFVIKLGDGPTHEVLEYALTALQRLSHRGGVDADACSGDGAGLLTAVPQRLVALAARQLRIPLPAIFGLGMLFIERDQEARVQAEFKKIVTSMGLQLLGWRQVPTQSAVLGPRAAESAPAVWQCFVAEHDQTVAFDRQLFLLRKRAEAELANAAYFCSLSSRTVVYKGLLAPWQLPRFYPDLANRDFQTPFAIFHQRFSTNTQPTWRLAQPFRLLAHNGEINTITGNRRWMNAREQEIRACLKTGQWFAALENHVSDSASLDNAIELLAQQGQCIDHAVLSLVPPVADDRLDRKTLELVAHSACEYEPWDGPAALVFSDGQLLGAKLDRNGLRPMRFTRTSTGWLVAGSETGLADFEEDQIAERQRLGPGEALLIDIASGKVFPRGTHVREIADPKPPSRSMATVHSFPSTHTEISAVAEPRRLAAALGWSEDQIGFLLQPLAQGKEAIYSMGDDTPPAFLSKMRRPLWDYCKQRFAQVTNPPIDPLREAQVMSLDTRIGANFITDSPVLDEQQMRALEHGYASTQRIDVTFECAQGVAGAMDALERIRHEVRWNSGAAPSAVIISDRCVNQQHAAVPILLAVACVWKQMVNGGHFRVPLVVETAQVIDVHHVALLLAAGAAGVRPFLAQQLAEEQLPGGRRNYCLAISAGLKKVLSRMGISTLASYRNSQLFEVLGLDEDLCRDFFETAPQWPGATSLPQLLEDYLFNHAQAFRTEFRAPVDAGLYRFRKQGEQHATSGELLRKLHAHVKNPGSGHYQQFEALAQERVPVAVRDLLKISAVESRCCGPVESEADILRRFSAQAMSIGALSPEAHRTLALAMNELGARSNTGEGGEDPDIYITAPEAACRIKQVASGRFGVTAEYLVNAEEIEIKIAQGSKPGEGGQLPASKVTAYIAKLRHAVPGMALISPPPHHDIYSIEDLEQLIHDLHQISPAARIGVKLVAGAGVGIIAAGVAKAGADVITISGYDGGTGASPLSSIKNTGVPWEYGLRDAHRTLVMAGLRQYVRLRVDGGLKFARDVVIAALLGADEFGFGTAALLAMGCVMARQCHLNTCPVGIATQNEQLRVRFAGSTDMVKSYFRALAAEVQAWLGRLGARSLEEIVGRTDLLFPRTEEADRWLRGLLQPVARAPHAVARSRKSGRLSQRVLQMADSSRILTPTVLTIVNSDRSIGTELSGERLRGKKSGRTSVPLELHFRGTAGQSFGAFLAAGVKFHLYGAANDYVAKGLSGGTIAITAGKQASKRKDVLVGNTVLYGATSGELYVAGQAGERFAVRNSGAVAVVEGVGDHACEYMTGGVVVVLGPIGINLGSGMTGGLTYLLTNEVRANSCNSDFVLLQPCTAEEEQAVRQLLIRHWILTRSSQTAFFLESGMRLPITRIQPLDLPCPVSDTWKPILQRLENAALTALGTTMRSANTEHLELPLRETVVTRPEMAAVPTPVRNSRSGGR